MKTIVHTIRRLLLTLVVTSFAGSISAQTVSIPDPGLNAAIRSALQIPSAPLTVQNLLTLTNLDANRRNVRSTVGLETASNLVSLNLQINLLTNFPIPATFTKLSVLDVSANSLTQLSVPNSLTNLTSLTGEGCGLTNVTLPPTLTALTNFDIEGNNVSSFNLPATLTRIVSLDLGFNLFTSFSLPAGFTNLSTFYFAGNPLTNVIFPPGLSGMTELNLSQNLLTNFTLPAGMTNLEELDLAFNQLTNVTLPNDLRNLAELELDFNQLTGLNLPPNLTNLSFLHLRANQFTSFSVPSGLTALTYLDVSGAPLTNITFNGDLGNLRLLRLSGNRLSTLTLPLGLTNLTALNLTANQLTNLVLPPDLGQLETIDVGGNALTSLTLPSGLIHLTGLFFVANQITSLTIPPDMTNLVSLGFLANPFTTLVAPETLDTTNLNGAFGTLESQGVVVFSYPLTVQLISLRRTADFFQFAVSGPPGVYTVRGSSDLTGWSDLATVTNELGFARFDDRQANLFPRRFYRALRQVPPSNMVFIPPNTFTMGSPTNEVDRATDEGPQTTVILTRGFWIGKFEVTQGDYLSEMNTNPSSFPGDLSRPVTSVSWPEATNYCAKLTQRELAAGRISAGSQYRLPTEAEWECAARAGTSTRFSYGDDPGYTNLAEHAWYFLNSGFMPHPVGQKLPNPWGLYDMEGNAVEWCQDWAGFLPGGIQTDPTGNPSSASGRKITRGGAFDNFEASSRSAERSLFNAGPLDSDTDLGFRVVLVAAPQ